MARGRCSRHGQLGLENDGNSEVPKRVAALSSRAVSKVRAGVPAAAYQPGDARGGATAYSAVRRATHPWAYTMRLPVERRALPCGAAGRMRRDAHAGDRRRESLWLGIERVRRVALRCNTVLQHCVATMSYCVATCTTDMISSIRVG